MSHAFITSLLCAIVFVAGHFIGRAIPTTAAGEPATVREFTGAGNSTQMEAPAPANTRAAELVAMAAEASVDKLPALLLEAMAMEQDAPGLAHYLVEAVTIRWATLDPVQALDWIEKNVPKDAPYEYVMQKAFFGTWGRADPVAALEAGKGVNNWRALDFVLRANARPNPGRFLELVTDYGQQWSRSNSSRPVFLAAFESLGQHDTALLAPWMADDQPEHIASAAAEATAGALVNLKGADAYDDLASISSSKTREVAMNRASDLLIEQNLPAATHLLERAMTDKLDTSWMRAMVRHAMTVDDPFAALDWSASLVEDGRLEAKDPRLRDLIPYMRTDDAGLLHRFVAELKARLPRHSSIYNLIIFSGITSGSSSLLAPSLLARDLAQLPQDSIRDEMLVSLADVWATTNPDAAWNYFESLADSPLKRKIGENLLNQGQTSIADILPLAELIEHEGTVPGQALTRLARSEPALAIDYVARLSAADAPRAAAKVANVFAARDPEAGQLWLQSLPDEATKIEAAAAFAKRYAYDTHALSQWAATLPAGGMRDTVASQLVQHIAESAPDAAFLWAQEIAGDEQRNASVKRAIDAWAAFDPAAAMSAVESAGRLTPQERANLLRQLDQ
ncbi:MAG: hypothetical protein ACI9R3_004750 [Verrucomicrobiales bacterium]|jgi:hypothetical protein